jgi:hypothetical protein
MIAPATSLQCTRRDRIWFNRAARVKLACSMPVRGKGKQSKKTRTTQSMQMNPQITPKGNNDTP